jgi:hypothetical protein
MRAADRTEMLPRRAVVLPFPAGGRRGMHWWVRLLAWFHGGRGGRTGG